ncbi:MAG: hypothetical protein L0229_16365 [Blastocatellia bacterium]|nr:hypothetical protein [Blastocatellia bacterium]
MNESNDVRDADELSSDLGEVRKQLAGEVRARNAVIKPLERAMRALKDPHRNAVALYEACAALERPPEELALPKSYKSLIGGLRALSDAKLSELEFTFARDLRAAFKEKGLKLGGSPTELIADLFVITVDMRKKQVHITFSRQPVTKRATKLDVDQVVNAYERARKEVCERNVDLAALLAELFEAYQRTLKLADKQFGTRAGIVDCYRELVVVRQPLSFRRTPSKQSFIDYPKAHFTYDMLELRRQHKLVHEGYRLNLGTATIDVGADSTRALFLATGANEGQFIKDIYFTPEKGK